MSIAAGHTTRSRAHSTIIGNPLTWLGLAVAFCCLLLSLPLYLPIGAMYWDVYVYYDAANRIFDGQTPNIDFFAPVGPLGYYLFAGATRLFPHAQPTLLAHWAMLAVTVPLMAAVLWDVDKRSRAIGFALLIPFLVFALLPFNIREPSPFPGSDGFGIYNRQICQLLYVLVATLLFVRNRAVLTGVVAATMLALFLVKITGFIAGGLLCAYAFASGRIPFRLAVATFASFLAVLCVMELNNHMASTYIRDIATLVSMNSGSLAPRFLLAASQNFMIILPATVLVGALLWIYRSAIAAQIRGVAQAPSFAGAAKVLDHKALWLAAVLFAGIFFETQNTGSQAFIFLWPVALSILIGSQKLITRPVQLLVVATLTAAMVLPSMMLIAERAARAYVGGLKNMRLESRNLMTLGQVTMRPEVAERSERMFGFYRTHHDVYESLTRLGELPSHSLYTDFDFQILNLKTIDEAIDGIRKLEAEKGIRFNTIMSINFTNPFPWLMDRSAPKYIAIGADPFRAVPTPGNEEDRAIADADIALRPSCPPTTANTELTRIYSDALSRHKLVKITECYDAFVHPRFADKF